MSRFLTLYNNIHVFELYMASPDGCTEFPGIISILLILTPKKAMQIKQMRKPYHKSNSDHCKFSNAQKSVSNFASLILVASCLHSLVLFNNGRFSEGCILRWVLHNTNITECSNMKGMATSSWGYMISKKLVVLLALDYSNKTYKMIWISYTVLKLIDKMTDSVISCVPSKQ